MAKIAKPSWWATACSCARSRKPAASTACWNRSSASALRRCHEGESGVVISRYHRIAGYDWLAIPLLPYLYAVDGREEIPQSADAKTVAALRNTYRRRHLLQIAPDNPDGKSPDGDWTQLIGAAYDRTIFAFTIETTAQQDDELIRQMNDRVNKARFNLLFRNCADFSRTVLNFYHRGATHRSWIADAGITTPKQLAKSLVKYRKRNRDLEFSSYVIPQVPGAIHRSEPVDGVLESFVKSKKYVLPLAVLHPFVAGSLVAIYLSEGHFNPKRNATLFDISKLDPEPTPKGEGAEVAERKTSVTLEARPSTSPAPVSP